MGITAALNSATTGLAVSQRRAAIASNNVANAQTPGYVRRTVNVSENRIGGGGAGVNVNAIERVTDPALTQERRRAESAEARDQMVSTAQTTFSNALGEPEDPFSLFAQFQNLETSLRSLSQTPESQPFQSQAFDAARAVVQTFNRLSDQTQTTRQNADAQIAREVNLVNDKLQQIVRLNDQISLAAGGGRDATSLEDERAKLIDDVSAMIPVREVVRESAKIDLITEEGTFLIAGEARQVDFTPSGIFDSSSTLGNGALSGISINGTSLTPGTNSTFGLREGSIAGHFAVRDELAPEFQAKLDGLARDLIERFENIDPTLAPGAPGLFTDAGIAFSAANETGLASRIALNTAVDPDAGGALWRLRDGLGAAAEGPPGNAAILTTLLDTLTTLKAPPAGTGLNGQLDATSAVAAVSSAVGAARISAETELTATAARKTAMLDAELAVTGVDTDFELQQLILIEQAFAANARVIQTAQDLLRILMEI